MLAVNEVKHKKKNTTRNTGYQDYVNHFSHVADVFAVENRSGNYNPAFEFGKLIMQKVQNNLKIKKSDSEQVDEMMEQTEKRRMKFAQNQRSVYGSIPMTLLEKAEMRPSIYHGEEQDKRTL